MEDGKLIAIAKALADTTRFTVLREIALSGEVSVGDLAARVGVSQPTVSHHVKTLSDCGLVEARHSGQYSYFRTDGEVVAGFCESLEAAVGGRSRLPDLGWGVID